MIHQAGALSSDGVQVCTRCGYVLTDYRNSMVPEGSPALRGWIEGASVEVITGWPKQSIVVNDPPDCEPLQ